MQQAELEIGDIAGTFRNAQRYTSSHAKSFYFASHVLPHDKRLAAYAVYAFCRLADNVVDMENASSSNEQLQQLSNQLHYVYTQSPIMDPGLKAFSATIQNYNIPEDYFKDLLRGLQMDLVRTRYRTFDELDDYCYCVASVVGLIMSRVFGVHDRRADQYAKDLGTAMQLTNILRDVREDYERGRIYLPLDELKRFDVSEHEIEHGIVSRGFARMMAFQVERARKYYHRASHGFKYIPDDGSRYCVQLMSATYSTILERIERQRYDIFARRAFVPLPQKVWLALTARKRTFQFASDTSKSGSPVNNHEGLD